MLADGDLACDECGYRPGSVLVARITGGPDAGRELMLRPGDILGRDELSSHGLSDPTVSRSHARIGWHDGSWTIEDLGSAWGITRDGEAVLRAHVGPGQHVALGGTDLFIERQSLVTPGPPPSRRAHRTLTVAAALVVVAAIGASGWWFFGVRPNGQGNEHAPPFAQADARRLTGDLESATEAQFSAAFLPAVATSATDRNDILPPGSTVAIDPSSFQAPGPGFASVIARVTGPQSATFRVYLGVDGGVWKILFTERLG